MIYQGNAITVVQRDDGIATLTFDAQGESVNTLSSKTIEEFEAALAALDQAAGVKGLVIASAKDAFIVGADITEFHGMFTRDEAFLVDMNTRVHRIFNTLEDRLSQRGGDQRPGARGRLQLPAWISAS